MCLSVITPVYQKLVDLLGRYIRGYDNLKSKSQESQQLRVFLLKTAKLLLIFFINALKCKACQNIGLNTTILKEGTFHIWDIVSVWSGGA